MFIFFPKYWKVSINSYNTLCYFVSQISRTNICETITSTHLCNGQLSLQLCPQKSYSGECLMRNGDNKDIASLLVWF